MVLVCVCESMEGIRFMNHAKRLLLGAALLLAVLLNACGSSQSTSPTDTLSVIYTSAAQTIEANEYAHISARPANIDILYNNARRNRLR